MIAPVGAPPDGWVPRRSCRPCSSARGAAQGAVRPESSLNPPPFRRHLLLREEPIQVERDVPVLPLLQLELVDLRDELVQRRARALARGGVLPVGRAGETAVAVAAVERREREPAAR